MSRFVMAADVDTTTFQVVLAPAVGDGGYVAVDVSSDEPWASLR